MITAFGTALLDSIAGPMRSYTIAKDGERALHLTCEEYITLRTDEEASPWTSSICQRQGSRGRHDAKTLARNTKM